MFSKCRQFFKRLCINLSKFRQVFSEFCQHFLKILSYSSSKFDQETFFNNELLIIIENHGQTQNFLPILRPVCIETSPIMFISLSHIGFNSGCRFKWRMSGLLTARSLQKVEQSRR